MACPLRPGMRQTTPQEGRHTAVPIMSANGVPIQDIADTVGHKTTYVTEAVYRKTMFPRSAARPSWTPSSASKVTRRQTSNHVQARSHLVVTEN
jgi:hypothetical protein